MNYGTVKQIDKILIYCATRCGLYFEGIDAPVLARRDIGYQKGQLVAFYEAGYQHWKGHICKNRVFTFEECGIAPLPINSEVPIDLADLTE